MGRIAGAIIRGALILLIVAVPAFVLPQSGRSTQEISIIIGGLIAVFTMMEYGSSHPGVLDFRFAPPFNRIRFGAVALLMLLLLPVIAAETGGEPMQYQALDSTVSFMSYVAHFPFSPCHAVETMILPEGGDPQMAELIKRVCGASMFILMLFTLLYFILIWVLRWPIRRDQFNLWVNLPTFEPTAGRDISWRLRRSGGLSILFGVAAPFGMTVLASRASGWFEPQALENPMTLIWAAVIWMILPLTLVARGLAMTKIAMLIERAREQG